MLNNWMKSVSRTALTAAAMGMTAFAGGAGLTAAAYADQVITDDLIVQRSACIGFDCVNGENFGFDTIRLKENNLRIAFRDTSNSASFPSTDWQLTANSSANGGGNYFSIDDISRGSTPFLIEGGAPSAALRVDDRGRIGIGTAGPVVEVHVVDGDSPTLRLEQDGSSGFIPQTWDIAGNETNFFVRDVTNGSRLPFKIFPNAPTNSLIVDATGQIGMGIQSPSAGLHVRRTDGGAGMLVEEAGTTTDNRAILTLRNNGRPRLHFINTEASNPGPEWSLTGGPSFVIRDQTNSVTVFKIDALTGDAEIEGELITGGTTCGTGCDAVFEEGFPIPPIAERAELMYSLGYLPNVGPTLENEPFNITQKVGRMLNELEHAHIYIAELEARLSAVEAAQEQDG